MRRPPVVSVSLTVGLALKLTVGPYSFLVTSKLLPSAGAALCVASAGRHRYAANADYCFGHPRCHRHWRVVLLTAQWPLRFPVGSLDYSIGPQQHRLRDGKPERLRSLQVDDKLKRRWLLDG